MEPKLYSIAERNYYRPKKKKFPTDLVLCDPSQL